MIEQWKDIPNYEGLYQVSNIGNVRSLYNSVKEAATKNNHSLSTISEYCRNILNCKDYIFTYKEVVSTDRA